jgi:hypothetical protein
MVVVLLVFSTSWVHAQRWAEDMFEVRSHDFGTLARDSKAEFRFVVTNKYLEDVHIADARPSCACTIVEIENPSLKTYEKGAIVARINTKAFRGQRGATITVRFDRPMSALVQLHVKADIREDVVFNPGSVDFGTIDQGQAAEKYVAVSRMTAGDWRVVDVNTSNPLLSAEIVGHRRSGPWRTSDLRVRIREGAPPGYVNDHLILATSDGHTRAIPLEVEGRILPGITVSPAPLFMGVVRPGQTVTKKFVIQGKKPFRITAVQCNDKHFQLSADVADQPKPVHVIPVTFTASDSPGRVEETIRIETDLGSAAPELSTYAVVAP